MQINLDKYFERLQKGEGMDYKSITEIEMPDISEEGKESLRKLAKIIFDMDKKLNILKPFPSRLDEFNNKYGTINTFNISVYEKDKLLFKTNSIESLKISRVNNVNVLRVNDALIDIKFFNEIMHGEYDKKELRIHGESIFRDLDHVDRKIHLDINVAFLTGYHLTIRGLGRINLELSLMDEVFGVKNVSLKDVGEA